MLVLFVSFYSFKRVQVAVCQLVAISGLVLGVNRETLFCARPRVSVCSFWKKWGKKLTLTPKHAEYQYFENYLFVKKLTSKKLTWRRKRFRLVSAAEAIHRTHVS